MINHEYELWLNNLDNPFFANLDAELDAMASYFEQSGD